MEQLATSLAKEIDSCHLWIVGQKSEIVSQFEEKVSEKHAVRMVDRNLINDSSQLSAWLPSHPVDRTKGYFPLNHPFSCVEVLLPCRIHSLHPNGGTVALPTAVRSFNLIRVEWPGLSFRESRSCYLKLMDEFRDFERKDRFLHFNSFIFADLPDKDQSFLLKRFMDLLQREWQAFIESLNTSASSASVSGLAEGSGTLATELSKADEESIREVLAKPATFTTPELDISPAQAKTSRKMIRTSSSWHTDLLRDSKPALILLSFVVFIISILYFAFYVLAPNAHTSGRIFSEQFKKFADPESRVRRPQAQDGTDEEAGENQNTPQSR
jgi:hypothetical protein